jgi:N-acetyl-gamma-glutamyl-phosphate/LysW-gamma-L-alpha-aminoadipyl-6-phosphate reductase
MSKTRLSIVGGSGYTGGELLRLLLNHPELEVHQVTSRGSAGLPLTRVHPQLRSARQTLPNFIEPSALQSTDVLVLALPHGEAQKNIAYYSQLAPKIVDLSADFRLQDLTAYQKWYGEAHTAPDWLPRFAYGLPEVNREQIRTANYVSGVGCNATASNLALLPLFRSGLIDLQKPVTVEVKAGSSEGGSTVNPGSHHPVRSGSVRPYAAVGHRHTAEIHQVLGSTNVHLSITAIELVRGAVATAHAFVIAGVTEKDLWKAYRASYKPEPFVRIIKEQLGLYRRPEVKLLAGTNFADVSFDLDPDTQRVVCICAIDNLMKGAAGTALQCINLMHGWVETLGLEFSGLHPI